MLPGRVLALLVCCSLPAAAQRLADLYGHVLDAFEGGIGQASITAVNEESGFRRSTESEIDGTYSIGSLQPGIYKLTVRKSGFRSAVRFGVALASGAGTRADFVLPVGSMEESITVYGSAPLLEQEDASAGRRLERDEIERLPLNGRGLLTLLELAPGTNVTPATRGEAGQFSAGGQRPNTNYFMVDGASANAGIAAGGLPAQSTGGTLPSLSAFGSLDAVISLLAVEDLRITTSTAVAEFGRMPGATLSITSRSGTNSFHGATLYRIRNAVLNANDWFANQAGYGRLRLSLHDFTQTLGGPLKRNRTFFFFSYQRIGLRQPYVWRQVVPSSAGRQAAADWAQPLLDLYPAPNRGDFPGGTGEWVGRTARPAGLDTGGLRLDHALTSRISLFARYNDSPSRNQFGNIVVNRLSLRSRALTTGLNARFGSRTIMDLRANESQADADSEWNREFACTLQPLTESFLGSGPVPCQYLVRFSIGGVGQLASGREGRRRQRQFQLLDSFTLLRNSHKIAAGVDYRRILALRRDPTGALGVIADQIATLSDKRNLWISKADAQSSSVSLRELSLFVQDTWQATERLTIAAGLRWEYSPAPLPPGETYFLDKGTGTVFSIRRRLWPAQFGNFAPRLGAAWRLGRTGDIVLRAGGGLYYDSSLSIATDVLNGGPLGVTRFTSAIYAPFSSQLSFGFNPDLVLPEVVQWHVSLERAFGKHDAASLGYSGSAGRNLMRRELGGTGSSPTSIIALTTNNGTSDYHALQFQYRRRAANGLQALASYTWSHSIDNDSSDAFLMWAGSGTSDRGSSDFDVRHSFMGSLTYRLPVAGGILLDAMFRARSGFPITPLQREEYLGINLANAFRPNLAPGQPLWVQDGSAPGGRRLNPAAFLPTAPTAAGPVQGILGRNVITGFGMSQMDLAAGREFRFFGQARVEVRIEAFNILNHAIFGDPVKYLNSPLFGQSVSMLNMMLGTGSPGSGLAPSLQSGGPRSLQGSLRFQF
jgi:hypothetical protein